ncbi:uncharacterized protein LOC130361474 [Hyla sarda]|uniref:uncharacterized protein LOC130361474 n=1 Tax=Hyla sarda TaxID=327740 RepID=UPI0024C439DF|nr:uncharacterized protein LOC130361474 [Hyla sarda]
MTVRRPAYQAALCGDRSNILAAAELAGFTLSNVKDGIKIDYAKKLLQMKKKETSLILHASTIAEYLKVQRIPRGLRSSLTPALLMEDREYIIKWYALCNAHSMDLMFLTVQHLQVSIIDIQKEIKKMEKDLKKESTSEYMDKIMREIRDNISKLRASILQTKLTKFERDTKDYQLDRVYTWAEERRKTCRREWNLNKTSSGDLFWSDSGVSLGERSTTSQKGGNIKQQKELQGARPKERKPVRD